MGCGCGKGNKAKVEYLAIKPNGETVVYKTDIEARMALTRWGGGRIQTRPVG